MAQPHERLTNALHERKKRKNLFKGLTWDALADQLTEAGRPIKGPAMRKMGSAGVGLDEDAAADLERILDLPEAWIMNGPDLDGDRVPPPAGRRFPQSSPVVVKVYQGGSAAVWVYDESKAKEATIFRFGEGDQFIDIEIADVSLTGTAEPSEVITFQKNASPLIGKLLLLRSVKDGQEQRAIRKLDPATGQYVDPTGRLDPLPFEEWQPIGFAINRFQPNGITV